MMGFSLDEFSADLMAEILTAAWMLCIISNSILMNILLK